jgi:hypothetical protein
VVHRLTVASELRSDARLPVSAPRLAVDLADALEHLVLAALRVGRVGRDARGPVVVARRRQYATAVGVVAMTVVSELGRGQPSLPDRLVARALALSVDPATSSDSTTAALISLARGNRELLERALRRVRARGVDRPSRLTARAADLLQVALEQLASNVAPTSPT